jgi:mRNA-degrading endonuclease RelE of RelBE toxin-antitoxin system
MDKIKKLFEKISEKDRKTLKEVIVKLISGNKKGLDVIKVKDSDFYRLKKGNFRIIFHYENKVVVIDSIKIRNEKTYQ